MSDDRWFEIENAVASAVRHFFGAASIFAELSVAQDRYVAEMAFLHAMLAGHTSLEAAMLRILELLGEQPPTGRYWHADLIGRMSRDVGDRPAVLTGDVAKAADQTRRFRSIAAHVYDNFDEALAAAAVEAATCLASLLPAEIARFRQAIDP